MSHGQLRTILQRLRQLAGASAAEDVTDSQLLERFASERQEEAFAALVRRHGPMVLGVCRRVLNDIHEAEDVFQATFLVLARRAGAIRKPAALASWLYGVAHRLALKARAGAVKRQCRIRQGGPMAQPAEPDAEVAVRELCSVVDEEVSRLPEKFRAPVVLCYLEGRAYEEVARQLGWSKTTVRGRLARARDVLRRRLTGRGLALPGGLLGAALAESAVEAVPALLAQVTVKAAVQFAAGKSAAAGIASARAVALAEGGLRTMFMTRLKIVAALVLVLTALGSAAGMFLHRARAERPEAGERAEKPAQGKPVPRPAPRAEPARGKPDPARDRADAAAVVKGNTQFAFDLYARLRGGRGNLFFSPTSLSTALAMTHGGAGGATAEQIARVFHFTLPQERLHPAFAALLRDLNGGKKRGYELYVANGLWARKDFPFRKKFLKDTEQNYGAGLLQEFATFGDERARQAINTWAAKQTQGKIKELYKPGVLTENTRRVLGSAIYFKGAWLVPFNTGLNAVLPFRVTDKQSVKVTFMYLTHEEYYVETKKKLRYLDGDGFEAVELPYAGKRLSMIVFLPKKVDGLAAFEKRLTAARVKQWLSQLGPAIVDVQMPKFTMTTELALRPILSDMGMPLAFNGKGNFSRMTEKGDTEFIESVVHKAFVEVNEKGTEAAAVTGIGFAGSLRTIFRANHPFVFLIRDNRSGSILFLGRLVQPEK